MLLNVMKYKIIEKYDSNEDFMMDKQLLKMFIKFINKEFSDKSENTTKSNIQQKRLHVFIIMEQKVATHGEKN